MLTPSDSLNRAYLEADLISGLIEASDLHHHGIPEVRRENFTEPPERLIERTLSTIRRSDLSPQAAHCWTKLQAAWAKSKRLSWDGLGSEGDWFREHGLNMALYIRRAVVKLLEFAEASAQYREAERQAVEAQDAARGAVRGI